MKKFFLIPLSIILCLLSSCITSKDYNLLQDIRKNYPIEDTPKDYRIIPGDQLRLMVYTLDENMKSLFSMYIETVPQVTNLGVGNADVSNDLKILNVASDGTIKIPYIGKLLVEDKTILEAKALIASRFKNFSSNVTVDVVLNNRYFSVLGELGYSRVSMDKQRLNIFQALAKIGSGSDIGNRKKVYIIRQTAGGNSVYKSFDIRSKDIIDSEYYYIQPNDVIYMPRVGSTFFGRISNFWDIFATISTVTGLFFIFDSFK
ncbi:polysaccharide biosynthesis/export family protein [Dysgonomonas sp. 520]|uniref:polysaccharide biosynthesis/export family protein n=1 Tax=Dysgonomonas sp. 520 TaxID=2302931 RepID=UPI0013D8B599|nr:polysaccharide biosynthesis/export family protein [Dysgonomonas sp. 520]NDW08504.1 hypothetical protein [Dysgonomonas sp. 520]